MSLKIRDLELAGSSEQLHNSVEVRFFNLKPVPCVKRDAVPEADLKFVPTVELGNIARGLACNTRRQRTATRAALPVTPRHSKQH